MPGSFYHLHYYCKIESMNNHSYNQFCAFAVALDVVGDRWTLLIIRELLAGHRRLADLIDGLPGTSNNADMQSFVGLFAGQIKPEQVISGRLIQFVGKQDEDEPGVLTKFLNMCATQGTN
jgi:hypothetical protein